ncbi:MAG TPA: hypothetical protein VKB67_00090 [Rhizomicrobium sp.]|nr:hypothetical protein [Rhizomicrobium sp.]
MILATVNDSTTAKRIKLIVACDHCGHNSLEALTRFHGRYMVVCRECASIVNLKAKENRIVIEELVKLCAKIDASLGKSQKHAGKRTKSVSQ